MATSTGYKRNSQPSAPMGFKRLIEVEAVAQLPLRWHILKIQLRYTSILFDFSGFSPFFILDFVFNHLL